MAPLWLDFFFEDEVFHVVPIIWPDTDLGNFSGSLKFETKWTSGEENFPQEWNEDSKLEVIVTI